ncbi:MAG: phosphate ABC transporter permease PstA, partial [Bacteroidaceae bacterium]|nr:phosphate ABC transporter permease PstA [Bacteroidaceae bacterium]
MTHLKTKHRLVADKAMLWVVCLFAALTALPLLAILSEVLLRGYDQLSWSFFTETTPTAYKAMKALEAGEPIPGGIANGIIGTMIMLGMAAIVAVPTGILCGAFLAENPKNRFSQTVSYLTDLLQGTPSVIIGIVTYVWVVVPMKGYSAIAGSVALFVMMLPLIIRSTEETLKILPASLKEAGLALGGNRAWVMLKVQLPAAFGGIFTGVLLAISRVIGETAPLMFTALGCSFIRFSIDKPISAVPLLIWEFFNDPNLQELIWGASLFL